MDSRNGAAAGDRIRLLASAILRRMSFSLGYIPKFRADYGSLGVLHEPGFTGELRFGAGGGAFRLRGIKSESYWLADLGHYYQMILLSFAKCNNTVVQGNPLPGYNKTEPVRSPAAGVSCGYSRVWPHPRWLLPLRACDQPRSRSACATPRPLVSDTSRSDDQPPMRTTTWMSRFIRCRPAGFPIRG